MRSRARCALLFVVAAAVAVSCIRYHEAAELMPDGSGRVTVTYSVSLGSKLLVDKSATAETVYQSAAAECAGLVAVTDASVTTKDGRQQVQFTGWFDDANQVRLRTKNRSALEMTWRRDGSGYALDVAMPAALGVAKGVVKAAEDAPKSDDAESETARELSDLLRKVSEEMWKGLDLRTEIRLPGKILSVEGFEKIDERTVRFDLDEAGTKDVAAMKRLLTQKFSVRCGPSVVSQDAIAAFRKELAAAKREWAENPASRIVRATLSSTVKPAKVPEAASYQILPGAERLAILDLDAEYTPMTLLDTSGEEVAAFLTVDGYGVELLLSPDGRRLHAVLSTDGYIATFEIPTGRVLWEHAGEGYWNVHVLRNGDFAIGKDFHAVEVHAGDTGELTHRIPVTGKANVLAVTHLPRHFVMSEDDSGKVSLVDAETGKRLWTVETTFRGEKHFTYTACAGRNGGPVFVSTGDDTGFEVFALDLADGKELWRMPLPRVSVLASPSGRIVITRHRDSLWAIDAVHGRKIGRIVGLADDPMQLTFGKDDETLWVTTRDEVTYKTSFHSYRLEFPPPEDDDGDSDD